MDQEEFFNLIKTKQMKEVHITFVCGCQLLYAPLMKEVFGNPCPNHDSVM